VADQEQARLTVEQGLPPGTTFTLAQLPAVIGRATRAEIVIDDRRISRLHARISQRENGFILEDLGSSNGVFVNGERITSAFQLRSGDQIGLGSHHRFRFELEASSGNIRAPGRCHHDPAVCGQDHTAKAAIAAADCLPGRWYNDQPHPDRGGNQRGPRRRQRHCYRLARYLPPTSAPDPPGG
jgi:predicted component of type VI protein secretion system